jgi:hypothetical protein
LHIGWASVVGGKIDSTKTSGINLLFSPRFLDFHLIIVGIDWNNSMTDAKEAHPARFLHSRLRGFGNYTGGKVFGVFLGSKADEQFTFSRSKDIDSSDTR